MKILKEKYIPLLKRKRITAEVEHFKKATMKNEDVLKALASELKVSHDVISLLHVYPHFGVEKARIIANIYQNKEDLEKFEKINKRKKKEEVATKQEAPKKKEEEK